MNKHEFEVTVERAFDKEDHEAVLIKLAASIVEVNVFIKVALVKKLILFHTKKQNYCLAGESASSPVHWKRGDGDEVYILIGDDQEVWDIGLTLDNSLIDQILADIRQLIPGI